MLVSLSAWKNAQYINQVSFVISFEEYPNAADSQAISRPPFQRGYVDIPPVGIRRQAV